MCTQLHKHCYLSGRLPDSDPWAHDVNTAEPREHRAQPQDRVQPPPPPQPREEKTDRKASLGAISGHGESESRDQLMARLREQGLKSPREQVVRETSRRRSHLLLGHFGGCHPGDNWAYHTRGQVQSLAPENGVDLGTQPLVSNPGKATMQKRGAQDKTAGSLLLS